MKRDPGPVSSTVGTGNRPESDGCDGWRQENAWRIENRPAIEAWNQYVEEHGIPLAEFRQL